MKPLGPDLTVGTEGNDTYIEPFYMVQGSLKKGHLSFCGFYLESMNPSSRSSQPALRSFGPSSVYE